MFCLVLVVKLCDGHLFLDKIKSHFMLQYFNQDLNEQWESLRDMVSEKTESLGSAHQVQRYFR